MSSPPSSPPVPPTKPKTAAAKQKAHTTTSTTIHLRPARLSDHPTIAHLTARAFHDDILFGHIIHPFRHSYPTHPSRYWLSRNLVAHFDWSHRFVVAVAVAVARHAPRPKSGVATDDADDEADADDSVDSVDDGDGDGEKEANKLLLMKKEEERTEVVIGQIHWSRMAGSNDENCAAGWGLSAWWDVRRLLRPLMAGLVWLASSSRATGLWRNRAADAAHEQIVEGSYGFIDHVWDADKGRSPSWYVESMAVDPDWQCRGVGRMLVEEGLRLAESEGISASVISADGKEGFYRRCGFVTGPVGRSGEGLGNPLWAVPGGLVFFREKSGARKPPLDEDREVDECMRWLRRDIDAGWRSSWIDRGCVD